MAREILSKRNFFDFESPDSAINMFHCAFKSHGLECTSVSIATPTVTIAHPNLSGHLIFDEQYIVDLDFFDVCFNFKNCVCHANDVAN
jgi:hypothetical protein